MRLKLVETIKGKLSGPFREPRQLVHTRRVRQIARKELRQIICKVTLILTRQSSLTPAQFGQLAGVPPEVAWLASPVRKNRRACKNDVSEFLPSPA